MVSKKAGKQRQAQTDAPIHVRRKRIRARLVTDDPELALIRTVTVRVGDEVEVLRGDFGFPNSVKADSLSLIHISEPTRPERLWFSGVW